MEAAETQVWIAFANQCGYLSTEKSEKLTQQYHFILGKLVNMARNADHWTI
jgi:four helix bundle protein